MLQLSLQPHAVPGTIPPTQAPGHYNADCWLQITASCSDVCKQQHSFGLLRYTRTFFPFADLPDQWWKPESFICLDGYPFKPQRA